MDGNEHIIHVIELNNFNFHIATHNKLGYSEPLWETLTNTIYFFEVLRHTAYMIKLISLRMIKDLFDNVRNWITYSKYNGFSVLYFELGSEKEILFRNPTERAVKFILLY